VKPDLLSFLDTYSVKKRRRRRGFYTSITPPISDLIPEKKGWRGTFLFILRLNKQEGRQEIKQKHEREAIGVANGYIILSTLHSLFYHIPSFVQCKYIHSTLAIPSSSSLLTPLPLSPHNTQIPPSHLIIIITAAQKNSIKKKRQTQPPTPRSITGINENACTHARIQSQSQSQDAEYSLHLRPCEF
jgi:hypothetical protein